MSDDHSPAPEPTPAETPAQHIQAEQKKKNLYLRLTSSMPLAITVIVHVILGLIAAAVVVQQTSSEKKKTFEAGQQTAAAPAVEHRLQVARRGGASGGASSPVSANRIFSTAENALQMPSMPDLPSMGAGGFGGFGGMGSGVGLGAGAGMSTSLGGGTGLGGRGFMSLSFLGATSQNVKDIVFVVDISTEVLDVRKGGFAAFQIVREHIARLVARLPPSSQFGVVFFDYPAWNDAEGSIRLYANQLRPASSENKKDFISWISEVNKDSSKTGLASLPASTSWTPTPIPNIDNNYKPTMWAYAVRAAIELQPDVVFVITGRTGMGTKQADEATLEKRKKESEKRRADLLAEGLEPEKVIAARNAALKKAREELDRINRDRVAQGKVPVVIASNDRFLDKDFQSSLTRLGINIKVDTTGWALRDGTRVTWGASGEYHQRVNGSQEDLETYISRVQNSLRTERTLLNLFYFVGPDQNSERQTESLTRVTKRNGGTFQLLTAKRLEEIQARTKADAAKGG